MGTEENSESQETNEKSNTVSNDVAEKTKNKEDGTLPDEVMDALNNLPESQKKLMQQTMMTSIQMSNIRQSAADVIMKKIDSNHISTYLAASQEEMQKSYTEKHEKKIYNFAILFLAAIVFIAIILILKDQPDVMEKIVCTVGGVIMGGFGGYGIAKKNLGSDD